MMKVILVTIVAIVLASCADWTIRIGVVIDADDVMSYSGHYYEKFEGEDFFIPLYSTAIFGKDED